LHFGKEHVGGLVKRLKVWIGLGQFFS